MGLGPTPTSRSTPSVAVGAHRLTRPIWRAYVDDVARSASADGPHLTSHRRTPLSPQVFVCVSGPLIVGPVLIVRLVPRSWTCHAHSSSAYKTHVGECGHVCVCVLPVLCRWCGVVVWWPPSLTEWVRPGAAWGHTRESRWQCLLLCMINVAERAVKHGPMTSLLGSQKKSHRGWGVYAGGKFLLKPNKTNPRAALLVKAVAVHWSVFPQRLFGCILLPLWRPKAFDSTPNGQPLKPRRSVDRTQQRQR